MKKTKEKLLSYIRRTVLSISRYSVYQRSCRKLFFTREKIRVLAKNHGYFNSVLPEKYALGDWIDLKAGKTVRIKRGEYVNIPLGVAMILPKGYEAHVLPRSSTFRKYHVLMTNSMGIIDNSYCGRNDEWCFPAYAVEDTVITRGDRIAQFRVVRNQPEIELVEVEDLTDNDRNGFGSSGVSYCKE